MCSAQVSRLPRLAHVNNGANSASRVAITSPPLTLNRSPRLVVYAREGDGSAELPRLGTADGDLVKDGLNLAVTAR